MQTVTVLKGRTTTQVAKAVGITTRTLFKWLELGLLPTPRRVKMPGSNWMVWSEQDIKRAKRLKKTIKRGRPKKKK